MVSDRISLRRYPVLRLSPRPNRRSPGSGLDLMQTMPEAMKWGMRPKLSKRDGVSMLAHFTRHTLTD
jgi:hypothetical protein